jgi:hypothetical protein
MPEKVTRQEKIISLAIEKARKAKEELSAKKRMNIEPTQVLEIDTDPEVEKIKRPKVQDASKITNQTRKDEGYGLAGESLKKSDEERTKARKIAEQAKKELMRAYDKWYKATWNTMMPDDKELGFEDYDYEDEWEKLIPTQSDEPIESALETIVRKDFGKVRDKSIKRIKMSRNYTKRTGYDAVMAGGGTRRRPPKRMTGRMGEQMKKD